jgi:hypothetical protein
MSVIGGTDVDISTGTGAGNINFLDDILGGEDSGTLTLAAGTGVITFAGDIGGTGEDEALLGVVINSAKSVTVTGQTYLDGTSVNSFKDGFTIGDGVNNVDLSNGGVITGFGEDGAGIFIDGSSTNSKISGFLLTGNTYGIYAGNYFDTLATSDLSGTVIDDNVIGEDDIGIYLDGVAGNPGLRCQLGRLLLPRHHLGGSGAHERAVRAVREPRASRGARHRHRFRARPP